MVSNSIDSSNIAASSSVKNTRSMARSMRTIRSKIFHSDPTNQAHCISDIDDFADNMPIKFAEESSVNPNSPYPSFDLDGFLDSGAFSNFFPCSSDISAELRRLAAVPEASDPVVISKPVPGPEPEPQPFSEYSRTEKFYSEIIESVATKFFQPTVRICVEELGSSSAIVKRSAAGKLRLLAKSRAENRVLIGESGAIPALIPLLRCSDAVSQEQAATALLNLSLHERNRHVIANAGAVKSLIYVLKTGTPVSKQSAACALLNLADTDESKLSIGASGAIPPLVALLRYGSNRGKKDALTTLYKLCSVRLNKQRAVRAGAVRALVGIVAEKDGGLREKVMAVLSGLSGIELGRKAIVEEGGIGALLEVIESGSDKGKEFAVWTLLQLCRDNEENRGFVLREGVGGGIPRSLLALSMGGTLKAKKKAKKLTGYLRESRFSEASSSDP